MIKMKGWEVMLVKMLALPILEKLALALKEKAESDGKTNYLDVLSNAILVVINFLKSPDTFVTK